MDIMLERIIGCIGDKHGATKALANYLDVHPNVITNWKNGRNRSYRGRIDEIAGYYGVSVDYLKGLTDISTPEQTKKPPATDPMGQFREALETLFERPVSRDQAEKLFQGIKLFVEPKDGA